MRSREAWEQRRLGRHAALVLGWRRGRRLDARRLALARDMDAPLRSRAQAALEAVGQRVARPYEASAQLEDDEAFLLTVGELPSRPPARRPGRPRSDEEQDSIDQQAEASALIQLLAAPEQLGRLDADDARDRSFLFYAAVFSENGRDPIAFLKNHNAASVLKTGLLLGQFGQTITRIESPVLVFERDFDMILDGEEMAVLRQNALARLLADIEIIAAAVPAFVARLDELSLPFTSASLHAISTACASRRLLARRLQKLLDEPYLEDLTLDRVRRYMEENREDPNRFVHGNQIVVAEEDVADFLDVLGQLHYRGGYDRLLRRADRSSLIRQPNRP